MSIALIFAIYLVAACAIFVCPIAVFASQNTAVNGLQMQGLEQVQTSLPQARVLGRARLTMWGFKVYDATLLTEQNFNADEYARSRFALSLSYLRDFKGEDIAKRSIQEMRAVDSLSEAQAARWLAQMQQLFPNVRSGDQLLGVHLPNEGVQFSFNGKPIGSLPDPEFARLFFGIWLSPKTSAPAMRRSLLGLDKASP